MTVTSESLHPENVVPLADLGLCLVQGSQEVQSLPLPFRCACLAGDELPLARGS